MATEKAQDSAVPTGAASAFSAGLGSISQEKDMAELHPELAKATATTALQFLASFNNEDFGIMREDKPGPHDRRHLAMALDYIQELGAMVLNLADRVPPNV